MSYEVQFFPHSSQDVYWEDPCYRQVKYHVRCDNVRAATDVDGAEPDDRHWAITIQPVLEQSGTYLSPAQLSVSDIKVMSCFPCSEPLHTCINLIFVQVTHYCRDEQPIKDFNKHYMTFVKEEDGDIFRLPDFVQRIADYLCVNIARTYSAPDGLVMG